MSNDEKVTEEKEKVMTKYDRKVQRRKEEKEKELREKRTTTVISILVLIGFIALAASFPIRSYMAVNGTFVTIGQDNMSKVEFDYNYNVVKTNYINAYGQYLAYFGLDVSRDLSTQMYDADMTWQDYFQEMTVDNLKRSKALKADAIAKGFQYDATEEYADFEKNVKDAASDAGMSVKEFVVNQYGPLATLKRIEPYVKENMMISAYNEKITKDNLPTEDEMLAHYNEEKEEFDSVDYLVQEVYATLPTEPTELADPDYEPVEGEAYSPSEAEIEKAMKDAEKEAFEVLKNIQNTGTLKEGQRIQDVEDPAQTWLFDSARTPGAKTALKDEYSNSYVVVSLVKRYRDETPTVDVRAIMTSEDGDAILDEWKSGEATEDSFVALAKKHTMDTSAKGALYEKIAKHTLNEAVDTWLFDSARKPGDTANLKLSDEYSYVVYYIGQNIPQWKVDIQNELSEEAVSEYVNALIENVEVKDPKNHLAYIKIREEQANRESEEAENSSDAEDGEEVDLDDLGIEVEDGLEVTDVQVLDDDDEADDAEVDVEE